MRIITIKDIKEDYRINTGDVDIKDKEAYILHLENGYLHTINAFMESTDNRQVGMDSLGEAIKNFTKGLTKQMEDAISTDTKARGSETHKSG